VLGRWAALAWAGAAALLAQGTFSEWTIPTPNSQPHCVVSDSRGRIWFAAIGANQVGMFDPATEQFRELRPPTANSGPHGIALGLDDAIWFTEQRANKIGRIDPETFQITEYELPNPNSGPHTPIYDGRGGLWFTEQTGNRIGRLNVRTGQIEEFAIPTPNSGPYGIIADAAGNAWFCSFGGGSNRIGRVDAQTGRVTEYATPTPNSGPRRPWIDSRGRIWLTENRGNKLAVFDPATERFREWDTPSPNGQPYGVVIDRNDQVWYNEFNANTMVRFDPATEKFTVFPFPTARSSVRIVAIDPANRVWYGENGNNRIGMIRPGHAVVNAAGFQSPSETNSGLAPGSIAAIFGTGLARGSQLAAALPLPTTLQEASVSFNDIAAPLFFVSPDQINAQVPLDLAPGTAWLRVRRGSAFLMAQPARIEAAAPAIFSVNQQGSGAGIIAHAEDFRLVSENAPARAGAFVAIFCTGLGRLEAAFPSGSPPPTPPPQTATRPQVTIAGRPAVVSYSGAAPGFVGLYQINAQVPADVPAGAQPVQIQAEGAASNVVTLVVR